MHKFFAPVTLVLSFLVVPVVASAVERQTVDCTKSPCWEQGHHDHRSHDERVRDAERSVRMGDMQKYGIPLSPKERILHKRRVHETMESLKSQLL